VAKRSAAMGRRVDLLVPTNDKYRSDRESNLASGGASSLAAISQGFCLSDVNGRRRAGQLGGARPSSTGAAENSFHEAPERPGKFMALELDRTGS